MPFSRVALQWIHQFTGILPQNIAARRMKGATSSSVFLMEDRNDVRKKFVLRIIDNPSWLAAEPDLAKHEFAALEKARSCGISAPIPIAYTTAQKYFSAPAILMSFVEGNINLRPANLSAWLREMAAVLAALHRHSADNFLWKYRSWLKTDNLSPPAWSENPTNWSRAIEIISVGIPREKTVFIHRDFHPTNVLWSGNRVSGIVDWINACTGAAGVDVAHCRMNLALMMGVEIADQFLREYQLIARDFTYNVYWEVESILDLCLPEPQFYAPWQEFGREIIPAAVLQNRADRLLNRAINQHFS